MGMGPTSLKWHVAVLIVEGRVEGEDDELPLVDVQYKLLRAQDAESAYQRAWDLAASEELEYENDEGAMVRWRCVGLHDLRELSESPGDGSEIYSWMDRADPNDWVTPKEDLAIFASPNPA